MDTTRTRSFPVVAGGLRLDGDLTLPAAPDGLVLFAHGSGSSRRSVRNRAVAAHLVGAGCATLLFDLLTEAEAEERANVFDIALLRDRLLAALRAVRGDPALAGLPLGLFGASTGAAAALVAAAELGGGVAAVVSRGGRPDLAAADLPRVTAPVLLIVGSRDEDVLELNRRAAARLACRQRLTLVPGATHLFEEPGALELVARAAAAWFGEAFRATGKAAHA